MRAAGLLVVLAAAAAACSASSGTAFEDVVPQSTPVITTPTVTPTPVPQPTPTPAPESTPAPLDAEPVALITDAGIVVPIIGTTADGGWAVLTPCGNGAIVASATVLTPVEVVLDPGHGGEDEPGTTGQQLTEAALNLDVAERTAAWLRGEGVSVELTRTADYQMSILARAAVADALEPRAFVSIHHNGGASDPSLFPGTEVYHQVADADSRRLAGLLWEELFSTFVAYDGVEWRGARSGVRARISARGADFYGVLRRPKTTAALVEALYLTNPGEEELLDTAEVRDAEAGAIGRAILRYLRSDDPGGGFAGVETFTGDAGGGGRTASCVDPALGLE